MQWSRKIEGEGWMVSKTFNFILLMSHLSNQASLSKFVQMMRKYFQLVIISSFVHILSLVLSIYIPQPPCAPGNIIPVNLYLED